MPINSLSHFFVSFPSFLTPSVYSLIFFAPDLPFVFRCSQALISEALSIGEHLSTELPKSNLCQKTLGFKIPKSERLRGFHSRIEPEPEIELRKIPFRGIASIGVGILALTLKSPVRIASRFGNYFVHADFCVFLQLQALIRSLN